MNQLEKFRETLVVYRKHKWRLARALMRAETLEALRREGGGGEGVTFEGAPAEESEMDAMWFTREAAGGREAWELRLVAEPPYALFEMFEADEGEDDRAEVRREMEARLRQHAGVARG